MIVECPHCGELLRTGEAHSAPDRSVNVRCPKCHGEGVMTGVSDHMSGETTPPTQNSKGKSLHKDKGNLSGHQSSDFTIPEDAFNHFRFPAETESDRSRPVSSGRNFRILIFTGLSILVVVFFAAVVNLVLPGPRPYDIENTGLPVDVNFNEGGRVSGR